MLDRVYKKDSIPFDVLFDRIDDFSLAITRATINGLIVKLVNNKYANEFVKHHHYLRRKIYIGYNLSYGIFMENICVGVCMFGYPVWHKLNGFMPPVENGECIELIRLCTIANLPRNTESYFIGKCLKMLSKNWKDLTGIEPVCVSSYCDRAIGFNGSIYRATNFELFRTIKGRPTNPGGTHGKWQTNEYKQDAKKDMYIYWLSDKYANFFKKNGTDE